MSFFYALGTLAWVLALVAFFEAVIDFKRKKRKNLRETIANFFIYIFRRTVLLYFQKGIQLSALTFCYQFVPFKIENNFLTFLALLILVDFLYWFKHLVEHRSQFMWAIHSVHHSSPEFNLSTALRLPWLGGLFLWIFYLPAVLVGFEPILVLASVQIVLLYQFWIHSEHIGSLGVLEKIFNTPAHHRIHHASNLNYLDKNFGGFLIIWDRLFGTLALKNEDIVYGLTKPLNSSNPLKIIFYEPFITFKEMVSASSIYEAIRIFFMPPGYAEQINSKSSIKKDVVGKTP